MRRKVSSLVLVVLLCNAFAAFAQTKAAPEIKFKRQIVACGINQNVKVTLTSKEILQGRIAEIRNDSFTMQLVEPNGQVTSRELAYTELSKVSKGSTAGSALKRGALYGAGFYAGMLLVALVVVGVSSAASR